jgi:hypothetical protein
MKAECTEVETAVSYYRRLAQGRIEIIDAEMARRRDGGSVEDLIAKLPEILAGDSGRPNAAQVRVADPEAPIAELTLPGHREELVNDTTLADLPGFDDDQLQQHCEQLRAFERELSEIRRGLHSVLDRIEHEVATRQAAGASG